MGMMEWLASQHNERTEDLTKPNTTHSLAALTACLQQTCASETIEFAYDYDKKQTAETKSKLSAMLPSTCTIVVFEDTSSGIKPIQST
jgi:hypothetical protein